MQLVVTVCWLLLALIHLSPALAFFAPKLISKLYGLEANNPLFALMHHRAALFVIVFACAIFAALYQQIRPFACFAIGFSMLSFIFIYFKNGRPKPLEKIFKVDLIGFLPLLVVCAEATEIH